MKFIYTPNKLSNNGDIPFQVSDQKLSGRASENFDLGVMTQLNGSGWLQKGYFKVQGNTELIKLTL